MYKGTSVYKSKWLPYGNRLKKKIFLACGFAIGWLAVAEPANALNGFINVVTCTVCNTTSDFASAASVQAQSLVSPGTYIVVSASSSMSAYIVVTGTARLSGSGFGGSSHLVLTNVATTPVDVAGNSLAGQTEAAQEGFYQTLDMSLFGTNRSSPFSGVTVPDNYAASFIGSEEGEVSPGIGQGLFAMGINQNIFGVGTIITVKFSDNTSALYIKNSVTATYLWTWTGTAFNKAGQQIDRAGNLIANPNKSGGGGGTFRTGTGGGGGPIYNLGGFGACVTTTTVTQGDTLIGTETHYTPC